MQKLACCKGGLQTVHNHRDAVTLDTCKLATAFS